MLFTRHVLAVVVDARSSLLRKSPPPLVVSPILVPSSTHLISSGLCIFPPSISSQHRIAITIIDIAKVSAAQLSSVIKVNVLGQ